MVANDKDRFSSGALLWLTSNLLMQYWKSNDSADCSATSLGYTMPSADVAKHPSINEPRCEKTGLQGFRPGPTQIGLYNHRIWLES